METEQGIPGRIGNSKAADSKQKARKPYLPGFLFVALGLWAGTYLSYSFSYGTSMQPCLLAATISFFATGFATLIYLRFLRVKPCLFVLGVALGCLCGFVQAATMYHTTGLIPDANKEYRFEVVEDMKEGDFGNSCVAELRDGAGKTLKLRLNFQETEELLQRGDLFTARTSLKALTETTHTYYWEQGIVARATVGSFERLPRQDPMGLVLGFRKRALSKLDSFTGEGAAFLRAVLFGDRVALNAQSTFYNAIKVTGLAHLVAVSGAHLVIVTSLFGVVLQRLRLPRKFVVVVQVLFILLYLVCAGIPLSAMRAACMTLVSMFSVFSKRASSSVNALALCLCCIIVANPTAAMSISLMLSAGATLGILLFSPLFSTWWAIAVGRRSFVGDSLSITFASGVFTTFICAASFSQMSLISPLANLLALPFFSFFCGGGLIIDLLALVFPQAGEPLLGFLLVAAQAFTEAVALLAGVPFAAIPTSLDPGLAMGATVLLGCALWLWWPDFAPRKIVLCAAASLLVGATSLYLGGRSHEIIMLDVGQGDAFVLRSEGSAVLIDTGNREAELRSALARHGIYHLDAVIITHADDDHCRSLDSLKGVVGVDSVLLAKDALSCTCASCAELRTKAETLVGSEGVKALSVGDVIQVGVLSYEVLWPTEFRDEGGNADSLAGLVKSDLDRDGNSEWQGFFCGDLEAEQVEELVEQGKLGDIDILKAGHHGARKGLNSPIAQVMQPEITLISVGADNRYGHPAPEVLEILAQEGSTVYQTKDDGDVVCKIQQDRIAVTTLR